MKRFSISWRTMPITAKFGVALWAAAWLYFLIHIYRLTQDSGSVGKFAIAVSLLLFFLLRGQNWARMIALMAGAMSILFLSFLTYLMQVDIVETALAVLAIAIFGFAIYFLCLRQTADYFKATSKIENPSKLNDPSDR